MNDEKKPTEPGRDDSERIEPTPSPLIEDAEPTGGVPDDDDDKGVN